MNIKINTDGGARGNPGPAASAFVAFDESGKVIFEKSIYLGMSTNNIAEYTALIEGLKWVSQTQEKFNAVNFFLDSELVVKQVNGIYAAKTAHISALLGEVNNLKLPNMSFTYIPRSLNQHADNLVNKCLDENKKG